MSLTSSLKSLRLKYYWRGVDIYDVVSLVGKSNIMYVNNFRKNLSKPLKGSFYYVSRQSITNGTMNCPSTPIYDECSPKHLEAFTLDGRCIVIAGDPNQFKAMLIKDDISIPVVLGRESFAIRFNTAEDAVSAHAWFLSDEVSLAIRAMLREKSIATGKRNLRITMSEVMELPIPSMKWLNDSYSHGKLKAKCIGLGSHIVSSLQGANLNDPMYDDIVGLLETAVQRLGGIDDNVAKSNYIF